MKNKKYKGKLNGEMLDYSVLWEDMKNAVELSTKSDSTKYSRLGSAEKFIVWAKKSDKEKRLLDITDSLIEEYELSLCIQAIRREISLSTAGQNSSNIRSIMRHAREQSDASKLEILKRESIEALKKGLLEEPDCPICLCFPHGFKCCFCNFEDMC